MCQPRSHEQADECRTSSSCDDGDATRHLPLPLERQASVRHVAAPRTNVVMPFIVQRGTQLFLLAAEAAQWVLAELRFDAASCTYAELRKVRYDWPREAFGALLSRVAVAGEVDGRLVQETSDDFSRWLALQFQLAEADSSDRDA